MFDDDYIELQNEYKYSDMQNDMLRELIEDIIYCLDNEEPLTKDYIESEYYHIINR